MAGLPVIQPPANDSVLHYVDTSNLQNISNFLHTGHLKHLWHLKNQTEKLKDEHGHVMDDCTVKIGFEHKVRYESLCIIMDIDLKNDKRWMDGETVEDAKTRFSKANSYIWACMQRYFKGCVRMFGENVFQTGADSFSWTQYKSIDEISMIATFPEHIACVSCSKLKINNRCKRMEMVAYVMRYPVEMKIDWLYRFLDHHDSIRNQKDEDTWEHTDGSNGAKHEHVWNVVSNDALKDKFFMFAMSTHDRLGMNSKARQMSGDVLRIVKENFGNLNTKQLYESIVEIGKMKMSTVQGSYPRIQQLTASSPITKYVGLSACCICRKPVMRI